MARDRRLKELSLFTGVGGGLLASVLLDHKIIGAVEMDNYCCRVLEQRQRDDIFEKFPIFNTDIRDFIRNGYASLYQGRCDVVSAGFPCQPFSVAGRRKAQDDSRNMWPATLECIRIIRPRFCFFENVRGLLSSGYFQEILKDLVESGYDCRWRVLSAAELGATHKRDRLWIVAHTSSTGTRVDGGRDSRGGGQARQPAGTRQPTLLRQEHRTYCTEGLDTSSANVADTDSSWKLQSQRSISNIGGRSSDCLAEIPDSAINRLEEGWEASWTRSKGFAKNTWWQTEPDVGRLVDGISYRVDRLKALGNAQVPIVAAKAWQLLTEDIL